MFCVAESITMVKSYSRCPGNSPFCLGMVDYNCCNTEIATDDDSEDFMTVQDSIKRKKLSLMKNAK